MKKYTLTLFLIISILCYNFILHNNTSNLFNNIKLKNEQQNEEKWYKGNTHTHTTNSDGDTSPQEVVKWYKNNGYNFLAITDHNILTETEYLDQDPSDNFILIPGEEISSKNSLHLNALGIKKVISPSSGESKQEIIQKNVDNTRIVNGIPIINHPNFNWAISTEIIKNINSCYLFELYNGHPAVNNFGGGGFQSTEEMWDDILSSDKKIFAIASDDAHNFKEFSRTKSNPGRGWIWVKAKNLTPVNILNSIENGKFYVSTGVDLKDIIFENNRIEIHIIRNRDFKYTTCFIGDNGKILEKSFNNPAKYQVKGNEKYIRTRVNCSDGSFAWTQPIILKYSSKN